jgi:cysteate synthase
VPSYDENALTERYAEVLANSHPAYSADGGVRKVLTACSGETYAVSRSEAIAAKCEFERAEHIPINEASACACAGLVKAVAAHHIGPADHVLLNITGGGDELVKRDYDIVRMLPDALISSPSDDAIFRSLLLS